MSLIIYSIKCKITKFRYVGKTIRGKSRIEEHFKNALNGSNMYSFYNDIRKYGKDSFQIKILEICKLNNELNKRERFWTDHFNCVSPNGYNLRHGGGGWNWKNPEKTKKKLNESHRKFQSIETRKRISNSMKLVKGERTGNYNHLMTMAKRIKLYNLFKAKKYRKFELADKFLISKGLTSLIIRKGMKGTLNA